MDEHRDDQDWFFLPGGQDIHFDFDLHLWVLWVPHDSSTVTTHSTLGEAFRASGRPDLADIEEMDRKTKPPR
jgi:hypothetical protein